MCKGVRVIINTKYNETGCTYDLRHWRLKAGQIKDPPIIIKNLPASISRRLTDISSDETAFGDAKPMYHKAPAESGFCEMTEFLEDRKGSSEKRKRKNRRRNSSWFNPPYSQNVSTNIGRRFRTLISKHFPRNLKLSKIFNINTLNLLSYYAQYMAAVISQHNSSILRGGRTIGENYAGGRPCNCCVKDCPRNGTCQVWYKATIKTTREERDYTGLTAQTFKQRYNEHQHKIRDGRYHHSTSLSKHVWALKDEHVGYNIQWTVLRKAKDYQNTTKRCNLCLAEKLEIIMANKERSLNRRSELISKCRHENKFIVFEWSWPGLDFPIVSHTPACDASDLQTFHPNCVRLLQW